MAAFFRRSLIAAGALAPLLAACGRGGGEGGPPPQFKGIDITGADYARELALLDADGKSRTLADWRGKVLFVFFGFTQCPDVCPTSMVELATAKRNLGAEGDKVQGLFVTLDPERDTAAVLKAYVGNFDPSFVALRGTPEQTRDVAKHFKIFYAKVPGKTEGSYSIDHSTGAYLFDPKGRVRLVSRYGTGPAALEHDLRILIAGR
jgi:protein SCO1/2